MGYGLWNDMIEFNVVELIKDTNFIVPHTHEVQRVTALYNGTFMW